MMFIGIADLLVWAGYGLGQGCQMRRSRASVQSVADLDEPRAAAGPNDSCRT
jgi:hypothetical protein